MNYDIQLSEMKARLASLEQEHIRAQEEYQYLLDNQQQLLSRRESLYRDGIKLEYDLFSSILSFVNQQSALVLDLQQKIDDLKNDISDLRNRIAQLPSEAAKHRSDLEMALKRGFDDLYSQLAGDVHAVQAPRDTRSQLEELTTELRKLHSENGKLTAEVEAVRNELTRTTNSRSQFLTPPPAAVPTTRFPDVLKPEKAAIGQSFTIRVAITEAPTVDEFKKYAMPILISPGEDEAEIGVFITAPDFEIRGANYQSLIVPIEGDSEPVVFELIPQVIGERKIKVEFFQNHKYIGGLTTIQIVTPEVAIRVKQVHTNGMLALDRKSVPPDLTVLITETKSNEAQRSYSFTLISPHNSLFYRTISERLAFTQEPSAWMEKLFTDINTLNKREHKGTLVETLNRIGTDLFEQLFPRELKDLWAQLVNKKVKSILIVSDEPWIPWEIIRPYHTTESGQNEEDDFLCIDYELTRWIAGTTPPCYQAIAVGAAIVPASADLASVREEIDYLDSKLTLRKIAPRLSEIRHLLKYGGVELIHFACHGSFDPEEHEQSIIYLDYNEQLKSRDITGALRNFGKDRPLIFINACQTARGDLSLVGMSGWAIRFVSANASVFIGSLWPVTDSFACNFSKAFYDALLDGKAVGEAARLARLLIRNESDTTWLAYSVYADPLAKLEFI